MPRAARHRFRSNSLVLLLVASLPVAPWGCKSKTPTPLPPQAPHCRRVVDGFGPPGSVPFRVEVVASGLEVPWAVAFLPDGDLLVTERPGRLRLIENGALVPEPVATLTVDPGGEGGLQGLALHPEFGENRLFFVYFTHQVNGEKRNRLERWKLSEDHRSASVDRAILTDLPAAQFHHGGRLRLGPDGMLYASVGDARLPETAQDATKLTGKLLRLTPNGLVPQDNPDPSSPVFLTGVRNSEGFDWLDPQTLVVSDHGPSGDTGRSGNDEVSVARKGDNLGWPDIVGCESREGRVSPSLSWETAVPPGGAAVYTGNAITEWKGSVLVPSLGARHLHRLAFAEDFSRVTTHETYLLGDPPAGFGRLREAVMGPDGHLYVTTSNCDGRGDCPSDKDKLLRLLR